MMTKDGRVTDQTPGEHLPSPPPRDPPREPATKEAADRLEDHLTVRAADQVRQALRK